MSSSTSALNLFKNRLYVCLECLAHPHPYGGVTLDYFSSCPDAFKIQVIRRVLRAFNRPEKLVIFNGEDPLKPGTPLTFQRQWRIFSQATLVLGPHGAGLANLAWLPPPTDTCAKVRVVQLTLTMKAIKEMKGEKDVCIHSLLE